MYLGRGWWWSWGENRSSLHSLLFYPHRIRGVYSVLPILRACHLMLLNSTSIWYLGLARITRSNPWPKLPRTSIVFPVQRLAVSGYTTTSRVPRLGFPGGHAHGQPLSWISIELVPFPVPLDLPLPLSASRDGQPRSLTRNPTLGCAGSRGLALRHDADLWQYFSTEAWLIRTPRPTGWTNCAFE
jgi:hypothetical protein